MRRNKYAVSHKLLNRKLKNELRRARMSSSTNYYAGGTNTRLHRQPPNGEVSYSNQPDKNRVYWNEHVHANYTCDQGFVLAGNMTRTCGYSRTDGGLGQWVPDREPSCVGEYRSKKKTSG